LPGDGGVARIGDDGSKAVANLLPQLLEPGLVTGDANHVGAGLGERYRDCAAETSAGAGDQRCRF
jgi:hypothetical protein